MADVVELAELKFDRWNKGIKFVDLQSKFGINKHKAQRILKRAIKIHRLFTYGRSKPQAYFPESRRFLVIEHFNKLNNVPIRTTGARQLNHPLCNCLDHQKAHQLLQIMINLQTRPLFLHKIQAMIQLREDCYDLINTTPFTGNLGRKVVELIDGKQVSHTYYKNKKVAIDVACSNTPFRLETEEDIVILYSFFGQIRDRLEYQISDPRGRIVPFISQWTLKQIDFNKDVPITDEAQITLPDIQLTSALQTFRLYVKNLEGTAHYTCERSIVIEKPLTLYLSSVLNPSIDIIRKLDIINEEIKKIKNPES